MVNKKNQKGNKKILMSGNEAIGEGAIQSGCTFYAGYPITPQNELTAYMAAHMNNGRVFIQAESEISAINMIYGASAAGVRAMTSSSSPGMSLKQEGISYIAGAQLPAVIVNIMRGGPGLGNIWPAQSDYFQATRAGGHGDYHCIVLAPASVQECYEIMFRAFDLADKYRNPVIVLGDGMLGQMMEPVILNKKSAQDVKINKPWSLTGALNRKPNIVKSFYMVEGDLEQFNLKLQKKYKEIQARESRWEEFFVRDAKVVLVAYGSMFRIVKAAVKSLREKGKKVGLIRPLTLWPFPVKVFTKPRPKYLAVEMSYGQMVEDVKLALNGKAVVEFLGRAGGGVPSEEAIITKVNRMYNG
jgi:2-oxoglutarate ferredoxin oxidoreductase subunit alpha